MNCVWRFREKLNSRIFLKPSWTIRQFFHTDIDTFIEVDISVLLLCDSDVEEDGRLVRVLHLLDTEHGSMHLIVDPRQVGNGWALSNSAELVVDGTVTQAYPALVGTQVGDGNAAQMCANGGAAHDTGVASVRNGSL